ncbi:acyl-CoA dehydrogenase [Halioxenophilus sp. WMMB6]|uniref:acyl-CoA dehydrogenase n=1 Tax=Halioxenophilus sp. WMMB6 TaxID=3073815 RepID=UPI00295E76F0|nr:acyl-CoA dehydrogenase [Halioxenophilus sp. WMMB6]
MFLALDSHEREIADAAEDFLSNEFPLRRLHASPQDPQRLAAFAELGWFSLTADENLGGVGLSIVEEMLFFLEHGRVAGPLEVLVQTLAVQAAAGDAELTGKLMSGEVGVALLVESEAGAIRLLGSQECSLALQISTTAATLYSLEGVALKPVPCLDRSVAMHCAQATDLEAVVTVSDAGIWRKGQIMVSAMQIGLAQSALDMIVEYAKDRQTFGRPIGAYQAVRHPCSDMLVRIEGARSQLYYAATAIKEQHPEAAMLADAASLLAERAVRLNVDTNIQLHGGIGVTDEHDAHLLLKRANLLSRLLGTPKRFYASLLAVDNF